MNPNPNADLEALDEELVAYLDGELDEAAARRVEERLADDPHVRNRLRSLAKSWDMLDELPRTALGDSFTKSTVQMVTLAVAQEITEQQAALPTRRRRRWIYTTAATLAAAMLGFVAFVMAWPDPNAALLRDLPVVENLDRYRVADNVEFLRLLDNTGLFTDKPGETPWDATTAPTPEINREVLAERRARIAAMPADNKDDLRRRFDRYQALSDDDKDRLRKLDEQLSAEPDQAQLRRILQQYYDWLSTLSPLERADLLEMRPEARVARIRQLKQQEVTRLAGQLASSPLALDDVQKIFRWWEEVVVRRESEILALADGRQRRWIDDKQGDDRTRALVMVAMRLPRPLEVSDADWKNLEKQLSTDVVGRLSQLPAPKERQQLLKSMLAAAFRARDTVRGQVSQDELMRFYRQDLTVEDRNHAAILPPDEFMSQLRRKYFQSKYGRGGGRDGFGSKGAGPAGSFEAKGPPPDGFAPKGPPPPRERRAPRDD